MYKVYIIVVVCLVNKYIMVFFGSLQIQSFIQQTNLRFSFCRRKSHNSAKFEIFLRVSVHLQKSSLRFGDLKGVIDKLSINNWVL